MHGVASCGGEPQSDPRGRDAMRCGVVGLIRSKGVLSVFQLGTCSGGLGEMRPCANQESTGGACGMRPGQPLEQYRDCVADKGEMKA